MWCGSDTLFSQLSFWPTLSRKVSLKPNPYSIVYPFPTPPPTPSPCHRVSRGRGENIPLRIGTPLLDRHDHTSSSSYNTHIVVCFRGLPFYINALLTDTHTHTHSHTHFGDRAAHTSRRKGTFQRCHTTFINNNLIVNHYIIFSRNERIKLFFEVS